MPLKQRHKHTQTDAKHQPEQIYVLCPPGNREEDVPTECCVVYTSHQFECQTQQHRQREEQQISKLEAHPLFLSVCVCICVFGGGRTCSKDEEEFLSANIPGNVLRSSGTHLISKTSGMHHCRPRSS